jgi:ABC-type nitrate/sulfonate/bicarbonate transport system ATPase subunit/ABC-type nitrate/sulfonate/bicarbonate transport system permease component
LKVFSARFSTSRPPLSGGRFPLTRFIITKRKSAAWIGAGIFTLLLAWEVAALIADSEILFPPPIAVIKRLFVLMKNPRFYATLLASFTRVLIGIAISAPLGVSAGIIMGLDKRAAGFLRPVFALVSATPVMSVILIAFLIMGAERTPIFTAFLMIFPVMAANTLEGMRSVNPLLTEVFFIYPVSRRSRLRALYIPTLLPFIAGGFRASLSLCWKVVAAAEVLVQPARALGTSMQMAKANLETAELFAWTLATVIAAALSQSLYNTFVWASKSSINKGASRPLPAEKQVLPTNTVLSNPSIDNALGAAENTLLQPRFPAINELSFSFRDAPIFERFSLALEAAASPLVILGPSGCGKTTLLRLIAGLLAPTSGTIDLTGPAPGREQKTAFVFQDARLFPRLTALENVALPLEAANMSKTAANERALRILRMVALEDKAASFPGALSGGEAQRVAIARAFAYPANLLLMDEPFQSLDIPLRVELMEMLRRLHESEPRFLIIVTHDPREAIFLGNRVIVLGKAPCGVVFDETITLTRAEREYGAVSPQSIALERKLFAALCAS